MKRIMILGPSNAGKSTLACTLGEKLNLPVHHLDKYFWLKNWTELPFQDMKLKHNEIIQESEWIIDGGYSELHSDRVKRADAVIILDFPRRITIPRWLKRLWLNRGTVRPDMGGDNIERFNFVHLRGLLRRSNSAQRVAWLKINAPGVPIHVLRRPNEVKEFLLRL